MNKTKKLASLLLALVMAFALAMPAFALPNGDGAQGDTNITGQSGTTTDQIGDYTDNDPDFEYNTTNPQDKDTEIKDGTFDKGVETENCSITIENANDNHVYNAYQIFKGDLNIKTDPTTKETAKTLSNIEWGAGITADGIAAVLNDSAFSGCTTAAQVADKLKTAEQAEAFSKLLTKDKGYTSRSTTLNKDNNYASGKLDPGYYLIVDERSGGAVLPEGDTYSANIMQVLGKETMKPKAEAPDLDKKITGVGDDTSKDQDAISAQIGKKVNFELTSKVPEITGFTDKYIFTIQDTMSKGLTFGEDVSFTIGTNPYADVETTHKKNEDGSTSISIAVDPAKFLKYIKDTPVPAGTEIKVTYSATVNDAALVTDVETNTAKLVYSRDPYKSEDTNETPDSTVYVYDFDITILKYDGKDETNKTPLAGAQFVLSKTTGENKLYYKWNETTKKVDWIDNETDAVLNTDANGRLNPNAFKGLEAGTYTLHEVKAPDGYNTLKGDYTIKITENFKKDGQGQPTKEVESYTIEVKDWDGNLVGKKDADGNVQPEVINVADHKGSPAGTQLTQNIDVPNNSGALLPETGGIGTTIFYVVGGVLAAGAVILLITKRRMNIDK